MLIAKGQSPGPVNLILKKPKENLHQRAYLNTVTAGIDYGARMIVGFIINPIMVAILGPVFYGVWKIICQLMGYMATADIAASQPLKWLIAKERTVRTEDELRRTLTAALFATGVFLPLYLAAGVVLAWLAPHVAGVEEQYHTVVRSASAFLVAAFIINQLFSMFESILRGMNLAYKRMGIRASITILAGFLTAGALYLGYGLSGIAAVHVVVSLITGVTFWWVVSENVPWFGFKKVKFQEVLRFIKLSGWFTGSKLVGIAYKSSDIILLGILAGPTFVAVYAISKFLMYSAQTAVSNILPAVTPGLGKLIGGKEDEKLFKARSQMITLIWIFVTATGAVICLWNKSFVSIWTSQEYFAGQLETTLIVLVALQATVQQVDTAIIVISLDLRKLIILTAFAVVMSVGLAIILVPIFQIAGLLFAFLTGKVLTSIGYTHIVSRMTGRTNLLRDVLFSRTAVICNLILFITGYLGRFVGDTGWIQLIIAIAISFAIVSGLIWMLALSRYDRDGIVSNIRKIHLMKTYNSSFAK